MRSSSSSRLIHRVLFFGALLLCLPAVALLVLFSGPFETWRLTKAEHLLSEAMGTEIKVKGPVAIGFDLEPEITIENIAAVSNGLPPDLKTMSAKSVTLEVPLLALLAGHVQLNSLVIDGLKLSIEIPEGGAAADESGLSVATIVGGLARSDYAGDLILRNAKLDYVNRDSGFDLFYEFDEIASQRMEGGGGKIDGKGRLNNEPWHLDGKVDPPGADEGQRKFNIGVIHAGLNTALDGTYSLDPSSDRPTGDTVDMTLTASAPKLTRFLRIYEIKGDLEGAGDLSGRLTGSLDALKLTDFALKLDFETGDTYAFTGAIGDVAAGTGLALVFDGSFARANAADKQVKPIYDIGITGFNGRIEGALDGVLVRDLHVYTSSINANFKDIGPVTAERLYKDKDGRLGLYDVLVLAGDPARPSLRVTGTVKDIIAFKGVDLKGQIDFLTADLLDFAAEERAEELGHLTGEIAISDADGSLGIESLSAKVTDSSLIKLSIDLVFDDLAQANEIEFAAHVDIPKFKPFAAALGSQVEELGQVKFDGKLTGSDEKIVLNGTTLVGATTLKGSLAGTLNDGKPVLSGNISSALLHLSDMKKLADINVVYRENVDERDADIFDYSKVWESLAVDLQVDIAKISGGGAQASHIRGHITYLAGLVGLDPLKLTYLGGSASANGKIDTTGKENSFALKGRVDNLRIGTLLREMKASYPVSGALHATYDLSGGGNTMSEVPRSLSGSLTVSLHNGWIGTGLLDLAGMNLPAWLLTRHPGGNQATLVCAVVPFSFHKGRGTTHGMVLETRNVQVVGVGYVDFRADRVDLRFKPHALQKQFIKIAQPFAIEGRLDDPKLRLTGAPVAGAVVGALAFPFNLLETIIQPHRNIPGRVPCHVIHTVARGQHGAALPHHPGGPLGLGILGGERHHEGARRR